jgi:hypothetical protein
LVAARKRISSASKTGSAVLGANDASAAWTSIASTRYGGPLGIQLEVIAYRNPWDREWNASDARGISNQVYWLPPLPDRSGQESIQLLLRESFGLLHVEAPPEWLDRYMLPFERAARVTLEELTAALETVHRNVVAQHEVVAREARFKQLLYEQGEEALEPVVRDVLRELGVEVEEPSTSGKEDGRFVAPNGQKGMLEIKGRAGHYDLRTFGSCMGG